MTGSGETKKGRGTGKLGSMRRCTSLFAERLQEWSSLRTSIVMMMNLSRLWLRVGRTLKNMLLLWLVVKERIWWKKLLGIIPLKKRSLKLSLKLQATRTQIQMKKKLGKLVSTRSKFLKLEINFLKVKTLILEKQLELMVVIMKS